MLKLTNREKEVLIGLCEGKRNENLSKELGITAATLKTHIANACKRNKMRTIPLVLKFYKENNN